MKLDRYQNKGRGKYALVKLREYDLPAAMAEVRGIKLNAVNVPLNAIELGEEPAKDFFVLRSRDRFAWPVLLAYRDEVLKVADDLDTELCEIRKRKLKVGREVLNEMKRRRTGLQEYAADLTRLILSWRKVTTKDPD